jgi:hypothetical protein
MSRKPRVPSYCLHKATGPAVVRIGGKDHYLGKDGTPESRAEYDRLIADQTPIAGACIRNSASPASLPVPRKRARGPFAATW